MYDSQVLCFKHIKLALRFFICWDLRRLFLDTIGSALAFNGKHTSYTLQSELRESGQHQRFLGSVATSRKSCKHGNLCVEGLAKEKGLWPIAKSIGNTCPILLVVLNPSKTFFLNGLPDHFRRQYFLWFPRYQGSKDRGPKGPKDRTEDPRVARKPLGLPGWSGNSQQSRFLGGDIRWLLL